MAFRVWCEFLPKAMLDCGCDADELPKDIDKRHTDSIEMAVVYINKGMLFQIFFIAFRTFSRVTINVYM